MEALRARLSERGTDDPEEVERRLHAAEDELEARREFRHVVVNDRLEDALEQLTAIVSAELDPPGGGTAGARGRTTLQGQPGKAAR